MWCRVRSWSSIRVWRMLIALVYVSRVCLIVVGDLCHTRRFDWLRCRSTTAAAEKAVHAPETSHDKVMEAGLLVPSAKPRYALVEATCSGSAIWRWPIAHCHPLVVVPMPMLKSRHC